jgi:hypothetical protein
MGMVEELVVRDVSSGRFHTAIRVDGGEPRLHDACNVAGEREYMSDMPDPRPSDELLCKRCFGG